MRTKVTKMMVLLALTFGVVAWAGKLKNPTFEEDFDSMEGSAVWGDYGEIFGEARQIYDGKDQILPSARTGHRVLQIDVPPGTWNGIWQQLPLGEQKHYVMKGHCLIRGDLPVSCATFLKVEFYDENDEQIEYVEGEHFANGTGGAWKSTALSGKTPPRTKSVRFVVIAGDNAGGEKVANQIFWDDVDVTD